ncbi:hypothetical protein PsAD13_02180 [Pseudovibrio sp. Ad13]|nr:hypothetical protein PsAD13_02180 [Pseudovibrio sp. Ad13]KZK90463.1 hypothetical protein PsAD46_02084 [Pseudovibrio sp. Ad46]KZK92815.1 hypothetical protein PsAD5_03536 [Pseudovibrio sp. Ad5]
MKHIFNGSLVSAMPNALVCGAFQTGPDIAAKS